MLVRASCVSLLFVFFVLLDTPKSAHVSSREDSMSEDEQAWSEFEEFREWKRMRNEDSERESANKIRGYSSGRKLSDKRETFAIGNEKNLRTGHFRPFFNFRKRTSELDPPPVDQPALMGRFIVNQADWTAVATISTRDDIFSFPIANVISVSDGPLGNGTGIPYMYLTPLDFTAQDLAHDDRATLLMTLAQGSYCKEQDMDPMDPRCARIILAGRIHEVKNSSSDFDVAKSAVFGRHPWLAHMPENHEFFFAKLDIVSIAVLDTFGGPKYVSVEDYMNPSISENHRNRQRSNPRDNENASLFESEERKFVYRI